MTSRAELFRRAELDPEIHLNSKATTQFEDVGAAYLPTKPILWPRLAEEALYGLPGDIVRAMEPHTEADPAALLVNVLAAFGSAAGRGAHVRVGPDTHHLNLFAVLVGETAKGRKGTSWGYTRNLMHAADASWCVERIMNGLSSGEGLIHAVRDHVMKKNKKGEEELEDEGVLDKRLLVLEPEFASILKVASREGNTLSAIIRQGWDGDRLQVMTRNNPIKATGAHLSMLGHVTKDELLRHLTDTEAANGFANRYLWIMVRRSKELPFGGEWSTVDTAVLTRRLKAALEFAASPRGDTVGRGRQGRLAQGVRAAFGGQARPVRCRHRSRRGPGRALGRSLRGYGRVGGDTHWSPGGRARIVGVLRGVGAVRLRRRHRRRSGRPDNRCLESQPERAPQDGDLRHFRPPQEGGSNRPGAHAAAKDR